MIFGKGYPVLYLMWSKPSYMRYLFTLCLAMVCMLASAQTPSYPEYPFQYNPDGNADGFIGLNDLLDLLSLYGQQYPESFYGDSTGAILFVGQETASGCLRASELAGSKWRVMTPLDALKRDIVVANHFSETWDQVSNFSFAYWVKDADGDFSSGFQWFSSSQQEWLNTKDGGEGYPDGLTNGNTRLESSNDGSPRYAWQPKECILVTEVYPEIEYHIVNGNIEEVQSAVSDSLSNGWFLQGGVNNYPSSFFKQAIWKYAE